MVIVEIDTPGKRNAQPLRTGVVANHLSGPPREHPHSATVETAVRRLIPWSAYQNVPYSVTVDVAGTCDGPTEAIVDCAVLLEECLAYGDLEYKEYQRDHRRGWVRHREPVYPEAPFRHVKPLSPGTECPERERLGTALRIDHPVAEASHDSHAECLGIGIGGNPLARVTTACESRRDATKMIAHLRTLAVLGLSSCATVSHHKTAPEPSAKQALLPGSEVPMARCHWAEHGTGEVIGGLTRPEDWERYHDAERSLDTHRLLHAWETWPRDRLVACEPEVLDQLLPYARGASTERASALVVAFAWALEKNGRIEDALELLDRQLDNELSRKAAQDEDASRELFGDTAEMSLRYALAMTALRMEHYAQALQHLDQWRSTSWCGNCADSQAYITDDLRLQMYSRLGRWSSVRTLAGKYLGSPDACMLEYLIESYRHDGSPDELEGVFKGLTASGYGERIEEARRHDRVLRMHPRDARPYIGPLLADGDHPEEVLNVIHAIQDPEFVPELLDSVRAANNWSVTLRTLGTLVQLHDPRVDEMIDQIEGTPPEEHEWSLDHLREDLARKRRLYRILRGELEVDESIDF